MIPAKGKLSKTQIERAPPPWLASPVVDFAYAAACGATTLLGLVRPDADDDGIVFDADGFSDGIGQGEDET